MLTADYLKQISLYTASFDSTTSAYLGFEYLKSKSYNEGYLRRRDPQHPTPSSRKKAAESDENFCSACGIPGDTIPGHEESHSSSERRRERERRARQTRTEHRKSKRRKPEWARHSDAEKICSKEPEQGNAQEAPETLPKSSDGRRNTVGLCRLCMRSCRMDDVVADDSARPRTNLGAHESSRVTASEYSHRSIHESSPTEAAKATPSTLQNAQKPENETPVRSASSKARARAKARKQGTLAGLLARQDKPSQETNKNKGLALMDVLRRP